MEAVEQLKKMLVRAYQRIGELEGRVIELESSNPDELMTLDELALKTGLSMSQIREYISQGDLVAIEFTSRTRRVRRADYIAWLVKCRSDRAQSIAPDTIDCAPTQGSHDGKNNRTINLHTTQRPIQSHRQTDGPTDRQTGTKGKDQPSHLHDERGDREKGSPDASDSRRAGKHAVESYRRELLD